MEKSIGILETKGFAAAFAAAEKILEDKNIRLLKIDKIGGGIVSLFFSGNLSELNKAFKEGVSYGRSVGEIIALHILPYANQQITDLIRKSENKTSIKDKITSDIQNILPNAENISEKQIVESPPKKVKESLVLNNQTKANKVLNSSSTIQRLRREALSTGRVPKGSKINSEVLHSKQTAEINMNKIESLSVHELRKFARSTNGFPIQGREISRANKKELLDYFKDI